jgi:hypothetical protein
VTLALAGHRMTVLALDRNSVPNVARYQQCLFGAG